MLNSLLPLYVTIIITVVVALIGVCYLGDQYDTGFVEGSDSVTSGNVDRLRIGRGVGWCAVSIDRGYADGVLVTLLLLGRDEALNSNED